MTTIFMTYPQRVNGVLTSVRANLSGGEISVDLSDNPIAVSKDDRIGFYLPQDDMMTVSTFAIERPLDTPYGRFGARLSLLAESLWSGPGGLFRWRWGLADLLYRAGDRMSPVTYVSRAVRTIPVPTEEKSR